MRAFPLQFAVRKDIHCAWNFNQTSFQLATWWLLMSRCGRSQGTIRHVPLTRFVKLRVAHAPGMPGTFSPPPWVSDLYMHHGTCVMHVPWCMPVSLYSGFLWSQWRGKRSRHSRHMLNPHFYVSGKRPMPLSYFARTIQHKEVSVWYLV